MPEGRTDDLVRVELPSETEVALLHLALLAGARGALRGDRCSDGCCNRGRRCGGCAGVGSRGRGGADVHGCGAVGHRGCRRGTASDEVGDGRTREGVLGTGGVGLVKWLSIITTRMQREKAHVKENTGLVALIAAWEGDFLRRAWTAGAVATHTKLDARRIELGTSGQGDVQSNNLNSLLGTTVHGISTWDSPHYERGIHQTRYSKEA